MEMWPELTETQLTMQKVGMEMAAKHDPIVWVQVEAAIREAYIEKAKRLGRDERLNASIADMFLKEEIFLVWPIIRRFCQQR